MKLFLRVIFLFFASSIFMISCASVEPLSKEEEEMQQKIQELRDLYAEVFKDKEAVFEEIKVLREDNLVDLKGQTQSVSYYYIDASGKKVKHGMERLYCNNEITGEGIFSKGMPNYYRIIKLPKKTLQVIFKDGKPELGILAVPLHSGGFFGIDLKNGTPLKVILFERDGTVKETVFDVSKSERRERQPWNGDFLSMKDKKIKKYADGKLVSTTDCESLGVIEEILGIFKKTKQAVDVHKTSELQNPDNK